MESEEFPDGAECDSRMELERVFDSIKKKDALDVELQEVVPVETEPTDGYF